MVCVKGMEKSRGKWEKIGKREMKRSGLHDQVCIID
jgi:hypothetical protein